MKCICDGGYEAICSDCVEHAERRRKERFAARLARSGLPTPLQKLKFADLPLGPSTGAARMWAEGRLSGLVLTGPVGVGKTYLAATATWLRLQRHPVTWVSAARLMAQLRTGHGEKEKLAADRVVTGTGAIVLDDLDKVNPSEFGKEVIFAAIDGRVEEGSPLLVTMNSNLKEIGDQFGASVKSRLKGHCEIVRMTGKDRRLD